MTIINAFGIGAGRAIADEIDNDADKIRRDSRRRVDALNFVERERLNKRFKQLVGDAENSTDKASAARSAYAASATSQALKNSAPQLEPSHQKLPAEEQEVAENLRVMQDAEQTLATRRPEASLPPKLLSDSAGAHQASVDQDKIMRTRDAAQGHLLDSLIADTQRSTGRLTRERVQSALDRLSQTLRARTPTEISDDEQYGVLGYLDFLEGFFEGSSNTTKPPEQIAGLMADIRMQLNCVADPARAMNIQKTLITSQAEDAIPFKGRVTEHRGDRIKSKTAHAADEEGSVNDIESQAETAAAAVNRSASAPPSSQSSLGKDAQRRREETIVSVTLRSV